MKANYTLCISALLLAIAAIIIDIALFYDNASEITFREVSYPLALAAVAEMLLFVYLLMKLQEAAAKKRKQQFPVIAGIIAVIVLLVAYAALITLRVYAYANIRRYAGKSKRLLEFVIHGSCISRSRPVVSGAREQEDRRLRMTHIRGLTTPAKK